LWLYPYFPPEATAALLLFLPVFLFEPLQRLVGRLLLRTAQREMDQANRTMGPIQEVARLGDLEELVSFAQKRIGEQLQLAKVELLLGSEFGSERESKVGEESFAIRKSGETVGVLRVKPYGAMISGETRAALEFLSEQLPGALDLCRLIEEKLRLERELAERERLAVLGQMAASISHNLKNPLGSIKTILQVQMENPELPDSVRGETRMVLDEIRRLSTKLNQLLQFSRPTILDGSDGATCDARAVLDDVAGVFHHEAERRGIDFHVQARNGAIEVATNSEAVHDILSNLILNALEATPRGGFVRVQMGASDGMCEIVLDDNGSGIRKELQQKILEPFFTTKTQGTGLGLSIAARRVAEAGGRLEFISPREDGRGTRCLVRLREVMK
jgi:signal transduction histidine kinase